MNDFQNRINQSQADTRKMLAEWRLQSTSGVEVVLPLSQRTLYVRDIGLVDLVIEKKIPNTLMDLVQQVTDGKISATELLKENAPEYGDLVNVVFLHAVVYPPVAMEPDEDHISPKDFVYGDKLALFQWVNREATIVRPFRNGNGKSVETAPGGKELREET